MPAVCRKGDELTTGHSGALTTTLDTPTQSTVYAEGKLIARKDDLTILHAIASSTHTASITGGSETAYVVGKQISRIGDVADAGILTTGATTVYSGWYK